MWPGHRTVYSERDSQVMSRLLSRDRNPSVRKASISPCLPAMNMWRSVIAGTSFSSPSIRILAGRVYSSITSVGENGAQ